MLAGCRCRPRPGVMMETLLSSDPFFEIMTKLARAISPGRFGDDAHDIDRRARYLAYRRALAVPLANSVAFRSDEAIIEIDPSSNVRSASTADLHLNLRLRAPGTLCQGELLCSWADLQNFARALGALETQRFNEARLISIDRGPSILEITRREPPVGYWLSMRVGQNDPRALVVVQHWPISPQELHELKRWAESTCPSEAHAFGC